MSNSKLPSVAALFSLMDALRDQIIEFGDEYVELTVGWSPDTGGWGWQTGDNSFHGGAYNHPHWAVITIYKDSKLADLIVDVRDQLLELEAA